MFVYLCDSDSIRHPALCASQRARGSRLIAACWSSTLRADEYRSIRNQGRTNMSERFSCKAAIKPLLLSFLLLGVSALSLAQKPIETIDATARGTSTQMGKDFNIKVLIYSWSTGE